MIFISMVAGIQEKICKGNDNNSHADKKVDQQFLDNLKSCTIIDGSLHMYQYNNVTFGGLQNIKVVRGYIVVMESHVELFEMKNLRAIEGRGDLWKPSYPDDPCDNGCSLIIRHNGWQGVSFPKLTEIVRGSVSFANNTNMCDFYKNIIWREIIKNGNFESTSMDGSMASPADCGKCPVKCPNNCWHSNENFTHGNDDDVDRCQFRNFQCGGKDAVNVCSNRCSKANSVNVINIEHCCHSECLGGCTGPLNTDCYFCKNLSKCTKIDKNSTCSETECVSSCSGEEMLENGKIEKNPKPYYEEDYKCVPSCKKRIIHL